MSSDIPANYRLTYSSQAIAERVSSIGQELTEWARTVREKSGADVLGMPILRGGIFFFADLVRAVEASIDVAHVRVEAYDSQVNTAKPQLDIHSTGFNPAGRSLLLIDDICDTGRTLESLSAYFMAQGADEVRTAVLIKRDLPHESFNPDYVGFSHKGEEWFVGYGMDDMRRFRNLPSIYVIEK